MLHIKDDEGWVEVDPAATDPSILDRVKEEFGEPCSEKIKLIQKYPLDFYGQHDLYAMTIEIKRGDDNEKEKWKLFALHGTDATCFLDWKSETIHGFNSGNGLRIQTLEHALDYLRFFCSMIKADDGPFYIIDKVEQIPFDKELPSSFRDEYEKELQTRIENEEALRDRLVRVGPFDADRKCRLLHVCVLHGSKLFAAGFEVQENGRVDMLWDRALAEDLWIDPTTIRSSTLDEDQQIEVPLGRIDPVKWETDVGPDEFADRFHRKGCKNIRVLEGNVTLYGSDSDPDTNGSSTSGVGARVARRVIVQGDLILESTHFDGSVNIDGCLIGGSLRCNDARIDGTLSLKNCSIGFGWDKTKREQNTTEPWFRPKSNTLDLDGLRVKGSFNATGVAISGVLQGLGLQVEGDLLMGGLRAVRKSTNDRESGPLVDLKRARIGGSMVLGHRKLDDDTFAPERTRIEGAVNLSGVEVGGDLDLRSLHSEGTVDLSGIRIEGALQAQPADVVAKVFKKPAGGGDGSKPSMEDLLKRNHGLDLHACKELCTRIGGHFILYCVRVGGILNSAGIQIGGDYSLVLAQIRALFCRAGSSIPISAKIGKNIVLSGLQSEGHVEFCAVTIGGSLTCISSRMGSLYVRDGDVVDPSDQSNEKPDTSATRKRGSTIGGIFFLARTHIVGTLDCEGLKVKAEVKPETDMRRVRGSFVVQDCSIHGKLSLRGITDGDRRDGDRSHVKGDLRLVGNNTVSGDLDLRDVTVEGVIELRRAQIGGDLKCGARHEEASKPEKFMRSECVSFDIEDLICTHDVDLTGLRVGKPTTDGGQGDGHVIAQKCDVKGRLLFCEAVPSLETEVQDNHRCAKIYGKLDLTAAQVDHLVLSGGCFEEKSSTAEVVLVRAQVERLELHDDLRCNLDLRNLNVNWWDFGPRKPLAARFKKLLDQDVCKERRTFRQFEQLLLADEHTREAESVRVRMWKSIRTGVAKNRESHHQHSMKSSNYAKRLRLLWVITVSTQRWARECFRLTGRKREATQLFAKRMRQLPLNIMSLAGTLRVDQELASRRLGSQVWVWICQRFLQFWGHGRPARWCFFCVALPAIPVSVFVFSEPQNFVPSLGYLQTMRYKAGGEEEARAQEPDGWGLGSAILVTLRYHIPMLPFSIREDWRPSPFRLVVGESVAKGGKFTAEDYAFLVSLFHWIWWPMVLLNWAGIIKRRRA